MLGLILSDILELPPQTRTGFLVAAFLPGGLLALNFTKSSGGDASFTIDLILLFNVAAMLLMPFLVGWLYIVTRWDLATERGLVFVVGFVFLPLVTGPGGGGAPATRPCDLETAECPFGLLLCRRKPGGVCRSQIRGEPH